MRHFKETPCNFAFQPCSKASQHHLKGHRKRLVGLTITKSKNQTMAIRTASLGP